VVHFGFEEHVVFLLSVFVSGLAHFVENECLGGECPVELHAHERALRWQSQLVVQVGFELVFGDTHVVGFLALAFHRVAHDAFEFAEPLFDVLHGVQLLRHLDLFQDFAHVGVEGCGHAVREHDAGESVEDVDEELSDEFRVRAGRED
jgi:hypothetical protein